ncbi:hypothetical protein X762_18015 [Mesorhizobium sp. LSHC426A00]|nr:hypothetical protein X762_18015 [Mesorhizobium sp. LSHC426A00]ESX71835.1 hypothetical protein X757_22275 [Mesorhizobium sp. LSHC414A00]
MARTTKFSGLMTIVAGPEIEGFKLLICPRWRAADIADANLGQKRIVPILASHVRNANGDRQSLRSQFYSQCFSRALADAGAIIVAEYVYFFRLRWWCPTL